MKSDIPFTTDAELANFIQQFEQCEWPYERWTHRAHLAVAVCYLRQYTFTEALDRVRFHIQQYNRICGDPNGYHETITILFMRMVAHRLEQNPHPDMVDLINELHRTCDMQWLAKYYSPERLWSSTARAEWVEPDREPLDF